MSSPSVISVIFPKPLPSVQKETEVDETGFTKLEKVVLRNTWHVICRQKRKYAKEVFLELYTENHNLLEYFRTPKGKISMHALHYHTEAATRIYDRLIEEGLDDEPLIHVILSDVVSKHRKISSVKDFEENIKKHAQVSQRCARDLIKDITSPTLDVAFKKLSDMISTFLVEGLTNK